MTVEYKSFVPLIKSVSNEGGDVAEGRFDVATLNEMDHDGDVTLPGFFGTQHAAIVPSPDWKHVPPGQAVIREVANEAVVDFKLNIKIETAHPVHAAIRLAPANHPPPQQYPNGFGHA